jgi:hypothetical protein
VTTPIRQRDKERVMCTTFEIGVRELDRRSSDGIDVQLLWHPRTNRLFVAVADSRSREAFELEVDGADALDVFRHPYAYANPGYGDYALAS